MTRYHAAWVLPVVSAPLRNATVVEQGGRIVYVGPRDSAPSGGQDVELGEVMLLPGLVNAHTHLDLLNFTGTGETPQFFDWVIGGWEHRKNKADPEIARRDDWVRRRFLDVVWLEHAAILVLLASGVFRAYRFGLFESWETLMAARRTTLRDRLARGTVCQPSRTTASPSPTRPGSTTLA